MRTSAKHRHRIVSRLRCAGASGVVAATALAACGSSGPSSGSYVGRASNAAVYVQWTRNGNTLTGELNQALLQGSSGQASVNADSVAFTGTVSGSSLTLSLNQGLGSTTNLTGTLNGGRLSLGYPGQNGRVITIQMPSAQASAYNTDEQLLRGRAHHANAVYAVQQAAQQRAGQIARDAQTVSQDISTLHQSETDATGTGAVNPGLATMRRDVATTLREEQHVLAEAGHAPSYTICGDADTDAGDADTVQGDLDDLQGDQDDTGGDSTDITTAITQLKQDAATLQADRSSDPQDVPADAPTAQQVGQAIATAKAQITGESGTAGSAMTQGKALYKLAEGYANRAQKACNAAGG